MAINLHLLRDMLGTGELVSPGDPGELGLERVRLLAVGDRRPGTLLVATASELVSAEAEAGTGADVGAHASTRNLGRCAFAVVDDSEGGCDGGNGVGGVVPPGVPALILTGGWGVAEALCRIQAVFDECRDQDDQAIAAVAAGAPLDEVLKVGARGLANPVAVFDASGGLVGMAGEVPGKQDSPIWDAVMANRGVPIEEIPADVLRQYAAGERSGDVPRVYESEGETRIACNLFVAGRRVGSMGAASLQAPFAGGQVARFARLASYVRAFAASPAGRVIGQAGAPVAFADLIDGREVDDAALAFQLRGRGWDANDMYQAVRVVLPDGAPLDPTEAPRYVAGILRVLPDACGFAHDGGVALVLHDRSCLADSEVAKRAGETFALQRVRAGVSTTFSGFRNLVHAYAQARATAEVAARGSETFLAIGDCYAEVLTRRIERAGDVLDICHPTIVRMWCEGDAKERELVRCLTGYLLAGRNFSEAARTLYLHRNTLIYRIERMGAMLGCDLAAKSLPADQLLFLTVSCLLVSRLGGAGADAGRGRRGGL